MRKESNRMNGLKLEGGLHTGKKEREEQEKTMAYQNSNVRLYSATNHVWYKTGVARSIQNREPLFLCFKERSADLNRLSLIDENRM